MNVSNVNGGVIFDAFGTLLKIQDGSHPYLQLMKLGRSLGRRPAADDIQKILCNPWTLSEAAYALGIHAPVRDLQRLEKALEDEVASIEPFEDAAQAIAMLVANGFKVAVCSNLAAPYGSAIYRHFPNLDAYAFSYALGAVKPSHVMYTHCLEVLGTSAASTNMIGDSMGCDCEGPRALGIAGHYLNRIGLDDTAFSDLVTFANHVIKTKQ